MGTAKKAPRKRRPKKDKRNNPTTSRVITCSLRPLPEWAHIKRNPDGKKKAGVYHGSFFHDIPAFGRSCWVVLGELDIDFNAHQEENMSEREIVEACVNYLNLPPPRKKYAKREPQPPYGKLELYKYHVKEENVVNKKTRVQIFLITDQRKNKNFWREGISR